MFLRKKSPEELAAELWRTPEGREACMKLVHTERKPLTHSSLSYAFVDKDGKKYYRFPKDVALAGKRFAQMQDYMSWMSAGMGADEFDMFMDAIDKVLLDGLGKHANVVALGAIIAEMKKRRKMVIHSELLYNFMAVQLVREDESPEEFDNDIQLQKVAAFKELTKTGSTYFFFHSQELKKLSTLFNMSESEWKTYWEESLIKQKALPQALKVLSSQTA